MPLSFWLDHFEESRAEIHQIFALVFWKIEDTKKSFWNWLTFNREARSRRTDTKYKGILKVNIPEQIILIEERCIFISRNLSRINLKYDMYVSYLQALRWCFNWQWSRFISFSLFLCVEMHWNHIIHSEEGLSKKVTMGSNPL